MTALIRPCFLALLGSALVVVPLATAQAVDLRVVVSGGGKGAGESLVVAEVKGSIPPGSYSIRREGGTTAGPAEAFSVAGRSFLAFVPDRTSEAASTAYTLTKQDVPPPALAIASDQLDSKRMAIATGGKPFTTYITDEKSKPYYYPVIGPTGDSFTRGYPMDPKPGEDRDHPHQRSLWFTHGNVNGFDFWASDPNNKPSVGRFGTTRETSRKVIHNGQHAAVILTTNDWLGPDGRKLCEDERLMSFYGIGKDRVIDVELTVKATAGPVTFGDTKEGMFGVRVASSMDVKSKDNAGGNITNAEGLKDDAAWGKPSPWVDYVGSLNRKTVGIAILNHPNSFRYPTTWHVRPYGLFAANPFGWHDFGRKQTGEHVIPAGESIRFLYRIVLHTGDTASSNIPAAFQAYSQPPRAVVEAK